METKYIKGGLQPLPKDERDFKLSAIFTLPKLIELPGSFDLGETPIYHQRETDFCTGCGTCGASYFQEDTTLSPEWSFAVTKKISGDVESFGADLRVAMKARTKYGAIEKKDAPFNFDTKDGDFMRRIENWPVELFKLAPEHQALSYFDVTGQYDPFDDIRATIWKFREQKTAVVIGVVFGWPLEQKIMDTPTEDGGGHCMFVKGWRMINGIPYLIVVNSYGKESGENGVHYFSREVINTWVPQFGAFCFVDKPREQVKHMIDNGIKDNDNPFVAIFKAFFNWLVGVRDSIIKKYETNN